MRNARLLILQNPGNISRFYLDGLIAGAQSLGLSCDVMEMGPFWQLPQGKILSMMPELAEKFRNANVGAVLSYAWNGVMSFPSLMGHEGRSLSFFEAIGIPQLLLWTDHPQWFNHYAALASDMQPLLRSKNNWHFVKSSAARDELTTMLGWANCRAIAMAEDPCQWKPMPHIRPNCDVSVIGLQWPVDERLAHFLDHPDPRLVDMQKVIAPSVVKKLSELWGRTAWRVHERFLKEG